MTDHILKLPKRRPSRNETIPGRHDNAANFLFIQMTLTMQDQDRRCKFQKEKEVWEAERKSLLGKSHWRGEHAKRIRTFQT